MHIDSQRLEFSYLPAANILRSVNGPGLAPLVAEATQDYIERVAATCPLPVQTACYECHLGDADDRVDLALCILPGCTDVSLGASFEQNFAAYRDHSAWRTPIEFLREWGRVNSPLLGRVPFVWLAFDLETKRAYLPPPCVGLCVDPDFFADPTSVSGLPSPADLGLLGSRSVQFFCGRELPRASLERLATCLGTRDLGVKPKHFSFMLSREKTPFKLDVRLDVERVGTFLERMGWPGPAERIQARVCSLMPWSGHVQLNLVLDPDIVQPLEIEFLTTATETDDDARFVFLEELVAWGLCHPDKARVLRRIWTEPLGTCATPAGTRQIAKSWYIKVRFVNDEPVHAKAYVGFMPLPTEAA
jgi:hypothetical protein